jgi:prevent-host-death family protein
MPRSSDASTEQHSPADRLQALIGAVIGGKAWLRCFARGTRFGAVDRSEKGAAATLRVAEDIVPIGELKAHLSEKIRSIRNSGRPLVVTQNGKAAAVLLSPEDFDQLTTRARFVAAVQSGLGDLAAGRVVSDEDVGRRLDARFGALSKLTKKK